MGFEPTAETTPTVRFVRQSAYRFFFALNLVLLALLRTGFGGVDPGSSFGEATFLAIAAPL